MVPSWSTTNCWFSIWSPDEASSDPYIQSTARSTLTKLAWILQHHNSTKPTKYRLPESWAFQRSPWAHLPNRGFYFLVHSHLHKSIPQTMEDTKMQRQRWYRVVLEYVKSLWTTDTKSQEMCLYLERRRSIDLVRGLLSLEPSWVFRDVEGYLPKEREKQEQYDQQDRYLGKR